MSIVPAFYNKISSSGGGSTPSDKGQFVELLDNTTTTFPTTRKDGTALQDRDYCVVSSASSVVFPFDVSYTLSGKTFTLTIIENQQGFVVQYYHGAWVIQAGLTVESNEIVIDNRSQESISGDAVYQNQANKQFVERCKEVLKEGSFNISNDNLNLRLTKYNNDFIDASVPIDREPTENSVNPVESGGVWNKEIKNGTDTSTIITKDSQNKDVLQMHITAKDGTTLAHSTYNFNDNLVLEDKTQTLTNKTISSQNNTISIDLEDIEAQNANKVISTNSQGKLQDALSYVNSLSPDETYYAFNVVDMQTGTLTNGLVFTKSLEAGHVQQVYTITGEPGNYNITEYPDLISAAISINQGKIFLLMTTGTTPLIACPYNQNANVKIYSNLSETLIDGEIVNNRLEKIATSNKTQNILLSDIQNESISKTAQTQSELNKEFKTAINNASSAFSRDVSASNLSQLNSLVSTLYADNINKALVEITQDFTNNYTPEFTFKKGKAFLTIISTTSAQIIGYNFSARLVDGNWIGEDNNYIEQLNFSMVPKGFDYFLEPNDVQSLHSTDIIINLKQNEELILDFGENWQNLLNKDIYLYRQPFGFIISKTITQRFYVYTNQAGRYRLATSTDVDAPNLIKIYKRKNTNWMPIQLNNVATFQNSSLRVYGDSITIGATNTSDVVNPTFSQLFASRVGVNSFVNRSVSGVSWTAISGRTRLLTVLQTYLRKPNEGETTDTVDYAIGNLFLNCGINDYAEQIDLNTFRQAVQETLDYVLAHIVYTRVFIISPFNIDNTGTYGNKMFTVDMYRQVLQQEAERYGFYYINGADFSLPIMADSYIYTDGLHLKQLGHTLIGQKLIEMLTKNYLADADKYLTHVNTDSGLANTGKTTIDGKPIYKFSYSVKSVAYYNRLNIDPNDLLAVLAHNGINCTETNLVNVYGYSSDTNDRIPFNWMAVAPTGTVNYYFTALLKTDGTITIHFPLDAYKADYEITFEFWVE